MNRRKYNYWLMIVLLVCALGVYIISGFQGTLDDSTLCLWLLGLAILARLNMDLKKED